MSVRCGIAGWVDKSLIDSKLFYPLSVKTSGDRLRFYASQFSLVEVDSTYYGIPKPENAEAWAAQTPADFTFDIKSFSLFTNHPTKPESLPPDIREGLPANLRDKNIYVEHMPDELLDESWDRFRAAVEPLRAAGKLGAVFFQFPPWFLPSSRSLAMSSRSRSACSAFRSQSSFDGRSGLTRATAMEPWLSCAPAIFPMSRWTYPKDTGRACPRSTT